MPSKRQQQHSGLYIRKSCDDFEPLIGSPKTPNPVESIRIKDHMDLTNAVSAANHQTKNINGRIGSAIHTSLDHGVSLNSNMIRTIHSLWIKSSSKMYSIEMGPISGSTSAKYAKQPWKNKPMIRVGCVHMIWRKERLRVRFFNVIVSAIIVSSNIVMNDVSIRNVMSEFTCVKPALSYRHCSIPGGTIRNRTMHHPPLIPQVLIYLSHTSMHVYQMRNHRYHVGHRVKIVFVFA